MKRLITILLLSVSVASAQTAKTRAALYAEIDTSLASGGQITAAQLRAVLKNVTASSQNGLTDGTAALASDLTSGLATKQAADSDLTTWATVTPSDDGKSFVSAASYSAMRGLLGLVIGTNVQAFDDDLTALAALSGTNTIYYRSASNTWSPVTISTGLDFTGGVLTATGGGSGGMASTDIDTSAELAAILSDEVGSSGGFVRENGSITGNAATATALQTARTINGTSFDGTANIAISASNITTGTLPAAQLPALTGGDATTTAGGGNIVLNTVNSNVGTFGSATVVPVFTVNAKGLVTAVTNTTITGGSGNVTAAADYATDEVVIVADGTGKGTKFGNASVTINRTTGAINAPTANVTTMNVTSGNFTNITGVTAHGQLFIGNNTSGNFTKSTLTAGDGISITNGAGSITINATATGTNTGDQNVFPNIVVSGQDTVTANSTTANLTLVAGSGMTITTNNTTKAVTLVSSGGTGAETGDVKFILDSASVPSGWGLTGVNGIPAFTTPDADYKAVIKMAGTVATPTFSPAPGEVADGSTITFLSDTSGVTFMATTNGTDPSRSVGTAGSSMVISGNTTYEVMAYKDGVYLADSAKATGVFTIAAGGPTLVETIDFDAVANGTLLSAVSGWSLDGAFDQMAVSNVSGTQGFVYPSVTNAVRTIRCTTALNSDMMVEATLVVTGSGNLGAMVRRQSGSDSGYYWRYDGSDLYVFERNAGAETLMLGPVAKSYASGDKIRIYATGTAFGGNVRIKVEDSISGGAFTTVAGASSLNPVDDFDGGGAGFNGYGTSAGVGITEIKLYNQ